MSAKVSGNLPPNVVGSVYGFLCIYFKNLRWIERRVCSASAVIQLKWWGEGKKTRTFLRPNGKDEGQRKATYAIRCSLRNFEAYTANAGVLTIYVMSEKGQIFGHAVIDKLPSLAHPVMNTFINVVTDTGQQIARVSLVFKLRESDRPASNSYLTRCNNVADAVGALLIKSYELQRRMNLILEEKNDVTLLTNLDNLEPLYEQDEMSFHSVGVEGKHLEYILGEHSAMDAINVLNYPAIFFRAEDKTCRENLPPDENKKISLEIVPFGSDSVSNMGCVRKAKEQLKPFNEPIKSNSPANNKKGFSSRQAGIKNVRDVKGCSVLNKTGLLIHCLISIPKGNVLIHHLTPNPPHAERNCLYLVVRMLWLNGIFRSDVSSDGKFAFHQVTSFEVTHQLLERLHGNFISIEVWKKTTSELDQIIGICKLPVHLFYLTFRDAILTEPLKNSEAIVALDDKLLVEDLFCGKTVGDLQVLFAMGTEDQIKQLQREYATNSIDTDISSIETNEHCFEITVNAVRLFQPPFSNIWGDSDCFVQYTFPTQDSQHPNCDLYLSKYMAGPRLCQESIQFKCTLNHRFLSLENTLQNYLSQAFPLQKLPLQVWCRYYNPKEEERLIAEANIPLSSLFNLIFKNDHMKIFNLNLEAINMNSATRTSHKSENIGIMEIHINYTKITKHVECDPKPVLEKTENQSSIPTTFPSTEDNFGAPLLSDKSKNSFTMLIKIERAAHLPNIQIKLSTDYVPPNCYVTVIPMAGSEHFMKTRTVLASANPCWELEKEITLPIDLLFQSHKTLTFHVWHVEDEGVIGKGKEVSDRLIGVVFVDLNPLLYGMQQLSGWYNIIDFQGICKGQIKIIIDPLFGMETAKATLLQLPEMDRLKERELLEDLDVNSTFQQSFDPSTSLLVDNLRKNLTHLEDVQTLMEQMLNNVGHENEHRESPEDISRVFFRINELICGKCGSFESRISQDGPVDETIASYLPPRPSQNDSGQTATVTAEELPILENEIPPLTGSNKCKNRGSRVAAAIFHSE